MKEKIGEYLNELKEANIDSFKELEDLKVKYIGKKGIVTILLDEMKNLSGEEKSEAGKIINEFKGEVNKILGELREEFKNRELANALNNDSVDITLPCTNISTGRAHILEAMLEEMEDLFISLGFDVYEGPEVELDLNNFERLNIPKGHPARDTQDTFYITNEYLLRSHTSPVQVRSMISNSEKTPMRMICPGKTYRRDNDDATHSHQFTQMEGLVIDKEISLAHLKGMLELLAERIFGSVDTRFRPSYYPFTEPSVEFDISCFVCKGAGCPVCKGTGWITTGGAGIVHPNVLRDGGYDPEKVTGYAFGLGVDRWAMIKYGITDIRTFYINDLRIENMDIRESEQVEN